MRVADKMNFHQVTRSLSDTRGNLAELQNQAATGKKLLKPSDNPVSAATVLSARTNLSSTEQFIANNQEAQNFLNFTEQALAELGDVFIRAKELALSQANDPSSSPQTMKMVAREVEQLLSQSLSIGNRRMGDRYVFGGFQTIKPPFDSDGNYHGDNGFMVVEASKGQYLAMNVPGSKAFLGNDFQLEPENSDEAITNKPVESYEGKSKNETPVLRGPASVNNMEVSQEDKNQFEFGQGTNILSVLRSFKISLESGDKRGVQQALDDLDIAREQVNTVRAQIGSRMSTVDKNLDTLEKMKLDNNVIVSQHEDADAFKVYSELKRAEGNLQASLQTSSKLIQPSLLDFLR